MGQLPVHYLGVPLIYGHLIDWDCKPLIDKITCRIDAWTAKKLSYGGQLQLIQSVVHSLVNFWCLVFVLPKKVLHVVIQKSTQFLWHSKFEGSGGGAKVSWSLVCLPQDDRGLGVKDLEVRNKAHHLKLIWLLLCKARSLWIDWITSYLLQGWYFWEVKVPSSCSYASRKLLKLHTVAYPLFKIRLGCGTGVSFWFDN